jgi:flagellar biosynthesis/type III secretory pathway M-ring protein FliF/YscJ
VNGEPSSVVSPGLWGFVAFFVLAVALYLLMRNMNARMRRMSYRSEELQREAEAEAAERRDRKGGGVTDGDEPPQDSDEQPPATP